MNTNSKQSTDKTHSGAVCRIIGVLFGLFAFIWLPTPEVDAALRLISPPDCDSNCGTKTDSYTVFRWTENPLVHHYHVWFSDDQNFNTENENAPEIKLVLKESKSLEKEITSPQVDLDLVNGPFSFSSGQSYYWRVVALDESGDKVEESPETFGFFWEADGSGFTVISGLVKSDLRQAALVGARVAVASKDHSDTIDGNNTVVIASDRGFMLIVRRSDVNNTEIPLSADFPLHITAANEGFKPTNKFLTDPTKLNGVELFMISDFDGDGITDAVENASPCLDDEDADTDDDGIADGDEDTNKNGVKDSGETDPCRPDTVPNVRSLLHNLPLLLD